VRVEFSDPDSRQIEVIPIAAQGDSIAGRRASGGAATARWVASPLRKTAGLKARTIVRTYIVANL